MRLGQIRWNNDVTAAIFEADGMARPIPDYSMQALVQLAENEGNPLPKVASRLASLHKEHAEPLIPIHPKEVWACGCTYKTSAEFRDSEHGTREGFYAHVYRGDARPEIFFKGTSRFCVGPRKDIGIRPDSKFTAPEPELAVLLGAKGRVLGYTIANDVSAWDIERENPLYLPQSKMYTACCSLGPVIVTTDEITDPYKLDMSCTITRGEKTVFSGRTSTSNLNRKIEQLTEFLLRSNPVPAGSILLTGTGIIVTEDSALEAGDVVAIETSNIGRLENRAVVLN